MGYISYSVAIVFIFIAYKIHKKLEVRKELQHVPAVPVLTLLRALLTKVTFDEQFEKIYKPALKTFGYARIWVSGGWNVVVADPIHCREVLANSEAFLKRPAEGEKFDTRLLLSKFLGKSNILGTDGHEWRRHRRIANPSFKKTWDTEMFGECTVDLINKFEAAQQEPIEVHTQFQRLTLDALGQGLFSHNFEAVKKGESSQYLKLYNEVMTAAFNPLYTIFPFLETLIPSRKYYHTRNDEFRTFLLEVIKERKLELKNGVNKNDLLSLMIKASFEETNENSKLTDEEVLNDLVTFFLAGHDTTANTLTTTFYYLAKYPEIQEKARKEILDVIGYKGSVVTPNHEQLKLMVYINCTIKESMRIINTVTQLRRYCVEDTTLSGGLLIPANTYIITSLWAVHHNQDLFPDSGTFNPDRFLDSYGTQDQAWMAFGFGSRMCLGNNFSLMEQKIVMAMLLQKFDITMGPNCSKLPKPKIKPGGLTHPIDIDLCFVPRV